MKNVNEIDYLVNRNFYYKTAEEYITFINNVTSRNKEYIINLIDEHPAFFNFLKTAMDSSTDDNKESARFLSGSELYYEDYDNYSRHTQDHTIYYPYAKNLANKHFKASQVCKEATEFFYNLFVAEIFEMSRSHLLRTYEEFNADENTNNHYFTPDPLLIIYIYSEILDNKEYQDYIDEVTEKICLRKLMEFNLKKNKGE